jgi:hypothetical protein
VANANVVRIRLNRHFVIGRSNLWHYVAGQALRKDRISHQVNPKANPMSGSLKVILQVGIVSSCLSAGSCFAQGAVVKADAEQQSHEQSWNREQKTNAKQDARAIVQQKAQARAEQRNDRMATSSWYGISTSRPSGSSTPFTSRYGSSWEMPGGRPYSWYPAYARPNYIFFW